MKTIKSINQIITVFVLLVATSVTYAQTSQITISEKGLLKKNKVYTKCDIDLTPNQLISVFKNDPNMKDYYKPIALNFAAYTLLNSAATILILWPVTESLYADTDPNWNLAYIGAACAVLTIPFRMGFDKHAGRAVEYYNSGYKNSSSVDFNFNVGGNGVGIVMNF